jgi:hypothetical protein
VLAQPSILTSSPVASLQRLGRYSRQDYAVEDEGFDNTFLATFATLALPITGPRIIIALLVMTVDDLVDANWSHRERQLKKAAFKMILLRRWAPSS